jgi:FkbM family methyltransferase
LITIEDEPIVKYNGLEFFYRPETTDWNIIREACGGLNTLHFDVEDDELWFDIGAHIGSFSCYAANKGAQVFAFEPMPDNFAFLDDNVALNNFESNIECFQMGVSKDGASIPLYIDRQNYGNCSSFRGDILGEVISVQTMPAKNMNNQSSYCLKIDTEGYEYDILTEVDFRKISKLVFEWHYWLIEFPHEKLDWVLEKMNENFDHVANHGDYIYYGW